MVIPRVGYVYLVTFPSLWLVRAEDTLVGLLELKWLQARVFLGLSAQRVSWKDS